MPWRHHWSPHWHQLDPVIGVLHTRCYNSADCDTDHSLIASKVRWKPRKIHHRKTKGFPRINTCGTSDPVKAQSFTDLTGPRRNLLRNQQQATRMPNGLTSVMTSTTQPWLHSAKTNARMLTGSRLAGKKCSQSRRPRGKQCWLTSRTLAQEYATPFE